MFNNVVEQMKNKDKDSSTLESLKLMLGVIIVVVVIYVALAYFFGFKIIYTIGNAISALVIFFWGFLDKKITQRRYKFKLDRSERMNCYKTIDGLFGYIQYVELSEEELNTAVTIISFSFDEMKRNNKTGYNKAVTDFEDSLEKLISDKDTRGETMKRCRLLVRDIFKIDDANL